MLFNRDGQKELREEHRIARTDNDLIRYHRGQFDGELCLFATDERFRGHGAGIDLLRLFHAFLREKGAKDYFVYTDTYSNYEFYNRQGFRQISSETVDLGDGMNPKPTFFLYEYRLGDDVLKAESVPFGGVPADDAALPEGLRLIAWTEETGARVDPAEEDLDQRPRHLGREHPLLGRVEGGDVE